MEMKMRERIRGAGYLVSVCCFSFVQRGDCEGRILNSVGCWLLYLSIFFAYGVMLLILRLSFLYFFLEISYVTSHHFMGILDESREDSGRNLFV